MAKIIPFNKNNPKIIDAIEFNGKYTDTAALRQKLLIAGVLFIATAVFACVQFFLF
ncbi:hypothetical protein SAMN04487770_12774 [Butyrivibrio sp. ob235]|uniref:hypothetical protein n=1 Tax=Butyrivibrio sp. ob235 TaxID=1761780 RepID=UPI0008AD34CD|nr:hypothetical protein [Butyrivibrio sp. ob235]SEM16904.1 hypothetical protein SAMN04487770_12774 [Butyrivibrio sp. ob235]